MSPASPSLFPILSSCSKSVPSVPPSPTDHGWGLRASNSLVLITARETPGHQTLSHLKTEMVHKARDETAGSHALPTLARPQRLLSGGKISILCLVLPMPMLGASGLLQHGFLNHAPEGLIPREVKCIM